MNLSELVTYLRQDILHDRSDKISGQDDRLWSDATLVRHIDEAQKRFARLGLVLRDATTPAVTQVTMVADQAYYTLHDSVLGVLSARHEADEVDLARIDHPMIGMQSRYEGPYYDAAQVRLMQPGRPVAFTSDEEIGTGTTSTKTAVRLRLYPTPTAEYAGDKVMLRVVRLPLLTFTTTDMATQQPELPDVHHIEMLDWAAYLCLRIVDHDLGDPGRAHEFRAMFEKNVDRARRDAMRKMFAPLGWSFGRNGFAWEPG